MSKKSSKQLQNSKKAFSARLVQTSDKDRTNLDFATKYKIEVKNFSVKMSKEEISDPKRFHVTEEDTKKDLTNVVAKYKGVEDDNGKYSNATLYGDFTPDHDYTVIVGYPTEGFESAKVKMNP